MDLCSSTSFKRSRRHFSIDVAEHRSILKNNHSTHYPRLGFTPETGIELPETGILVFLCGIKNSLARDFPCGCGQSLSVSQLSKGVSIDPTSPFEMY